MLTGDPYGPWWQHNLVIFDVETTGLTEEDRIVELGLVRFEQGEVVQQWGSLINPGVSIPKDATAIHGISDADVADAPSFVFALPNIIRLARGAWPVAYNASFDRAFLDREMNRLTVSLDLPILNPLYRWVDPLVLVRRADGTWGKNKLTVACERRGIPLENAHRATDDALAAGLLLLHLSKEIPPWTMTELLRKQTEYDAEQDAERRAWFEKKGIEYR
jgi:DNA polymerase III epsilon subunit family exonuclease